MRTKGFTLIEIMIVLVIIAVMSAVLVLKVTAPSYSNFLSDANKIATLLELLGDEAVYTNSVIVCDIENTGLICQRYKNDEWSDIRLSNIASWSWPKKLKITQANVNGIPLKDKEKIRFFPNGDQSLLSIQITDGIRNAWIDGDLSGSFKVSN